MTKKKIHVCPKCGGTRLAPMNTISTPNIIFKSHEGKNLGLITCKSCGYQGAFLEMDEDVLKEFQKQLHEFKKKHED
ncbi:MAG: hypothetical protein ABIJ92_05550 [Candidatus Aenigmatarchaeota archaeon]